MRRPTVAWIALGIALTACSSGGGDAPVGADPPRPAPPPAVPFVPSVLLVLGDSLSDTGNAGAAADYLLGRRIVPPTVGLCNPADILLVPRACTDVIYRQNRVSNGPVAVEELAGELGLGALEPSLHIVPSRPLEGTNYAIAGATARGQGVDDLAAQVNALLLDHGQLPSDALVVVMIGGNDALDALQAERESGAAASPGAPIVTAAVTAIGASVERLLDFGARRLIVANVPDLSILPAVSGAARAASDPPALLAAARSVTAAFNDELAAELDRIAGRGLWDAPTPPVIARFDLEAALAAALAALAASGGNTRDACFDSDAYRDSATAERRFAPDCAPLGDGAPRFEGFAFWDAIHPTGNVHAALGAALRELVR